MMIISILVCLGTLFVLLWLLRLDRNSLGLPFAYLISLLLIHVPGAYVHYRSGGRLDHYEFVETGIEFTAIGSVCFLVGVWLARSWIRGVPQLRDDPLRRQFSIFSVVGGWLFTYGLSGFFRIASLGAVLEKAGTIWMIGVLFGLRESMRRHDLIKFVIWFTVMLVYPVIMLLLGGFLSYGSAAIIVILSALTIYMRRYWVVVAIMIVGIYCGLSIFVNYFASRTAIRDAVWGGTSLEHRIDTVVGAFSDFKLFAPDDEGQIRALDLRLNQNYYAGLAAARIEQEQVSYLYGRSLWEGLIALVPRALWPEKPVNAGSPRIVSEMTGLTFDTETSFGVGNVMEFQINFGIPGLIIGFGVFGWLLGTLDRKAAVCERMDDISGLLFYFLPGVALIQPNGSMIELTGGAASALGAAYGWRWLWRLFTMRGSRWTKARQSS